jgi:hypothetical protein
MIRLQILLLSQLSTTEVSCSGDGRRRLHAGELDVAVSFSGCRFDMFTKASMVHVNILASLQLLRMCSVLL